MAAGDLIEGSQVEAVDGDTATVTSIRAWTALQRSYNLTVADYSTYFVTRGDIWVHNAKVDCPNGHTSSGKDSTDGEARKIAASLGYQPVNDGPGKVKSFWNKKKKQYISRDLDGHIGGYWKSFDRRGKRLGTYCEGLCTRGGK